MQFYVIVVIALVLLTILCTLSFVSCLGSEKRIHKIHEKLFDLKCELDRQDRKTDDVNTGLLTLGKMVNTEIKEIKRTMCNMDTARDFSVSARNRCKHLEAKLESHTNLVENALLDHLGLSWKKIGPKHMLLDKKQLQELMRKKVIVL